MDLEVMGDNYLPTEAEN